MNESDAQEEVFFGDGSLCLKSPGVCVHTLLAVAVRTFMHLYCHSAGLYTLVPKSCHKFEKDAYMFDT